MSITPTEATKFTPGTCPHHNCQLVGPYKDDSGRLIYVCPYELCTYGIDAPEDQQLRQQGAQPLPGLVRDEGERMRDEGKKRDLDQYLTYRSDWR